MTRLRKRLALISVAIFLIGGVSVGVWHLWSIDSSVFPDTITDVAQYEKLLKGMEGSGLTDHFPKTIPANASKVYLDYYPGCMQGGGNFQLRVQLPAEEVKQIFSKYEKLASHRFTGGDTNAHLNAANGVPTTFFYTSGTDSHKFPDSFEILVLGAVPYGEPLSGESLWNHGDSYGVAVDLGGSEVVYWAAFW